MFSLYEDPTVKYCEPNPQYFNIFSNVFYMITAYFIYKFDNRHTDKIAINLFLVGVGSTALHSLNNRFGQYLDELFMVNLLNNLIMVFTQNKFIYHSYHDFNLVLFVVYFRLKIYNLFLLLFTIQCLVLVLLIYTNVTFSLLLKRELDKAVKAMVIGTICWIIEQNYCQYRKDLLILHSIWHFCTSLSVFYISKIVYYFTTEA